MKLKSIIACGLLLLGMGAATTSCEDMFEAENNLVTTDLTPNDTLYQMMGIVQRMQKLAERTVLLGEVRADLLDVDNIHSTAYLQGLFENTPEKTKPYDPIEKVGNIYNQPADYYAVINSCNIYLSRVDSLLKTHGVYKYEKEVCATKCFRAWCYLELAKIYGEVPFVQRPVLTSDAAEEIVADKKSVLGMEAIIDKCIEDLQKYPYMEKNNELRPSYSGKWQDISWGNFFIPVRALLAELYMWKGTCSGNPEDYKKAVSLYHDFFCYPGEERAVGGNIKTWSKWDGESFSGWSDSYYNRFKVSRTEENLVVIPCDTASFYGNYNNLSEIFNSMYKNNYYPAVKPSQRIKDISAAQKFFFYDYRSASEIYYRVGPENVALYDDALEKGDLRLSSIHETNSDPSATKYNANLSTDRSYIYKWLNGSNDMPRADVRQAYVPLFRIPILYLHMAEALNGAGFPETAYAVLRYGLDWTTLATEISEDEFNRLCEIKSVCPKIAAMEESKYKDDEELFEKAKGSFVVWSSDVFGRLDKRTWNHSGSISLQSGLKVQVGIHSFGSGDTEYNDEYYWLDDEDTKNTLDELRATNPYYGRVLSYEVNEPDEEAGEGGEGGEGEPPVYEYYAKVTYLTEDDIEDELIFETKEAYDEFVRDYRAVTESIQNFLASDELRAKRQARVAQLILEEEALEGMFEGHRFYDLMRYQMRKGAFGPTITMPEYMTEKYGVTPRMTGKPWFLKLPQR